MKKAYITFFALITTLSSFAQNAKYDKFISDGLALLQQNKISEALEKYRQALKISPSRIEANYGIGVCYSTICIQNGIYGDSAIHFFSKVEKIKPGYRNIYNNLGMCYFKLEKYNYALNYFNKALEQDNNNGEYFFYTGFIKQKLGKKEQGCFDLNTASKLGFKKANELLRQYCQ